MEEKETVPIIPDTSILPKIAKTGYSIGQSIAEFVDNSIDAKIEDVTLTVDIFIDQDRLKICDDGHGLTKDGLRDAIVLGRSDKRNQLGEYGIGLKAASLSIGKRFVIESTSSSSANKYRIVFDEDSWAENKKWEIDLYTLGKGPSETHGTVVEISKLKLRPHRHLPQLRIELGQRFGPFLESKEVMLLVNGKRCIYRQPEVDKKTRRDFSVRTSGGVVRGWYALLKKGSQKGNYGFHTYRRGRLITTYDSVGFEKHPTYARLMGEIHMDHVPVTTSKREWIKESIEYREVEDVLPEELKEILRLARQKSGDEKINKLVKERLQIFKEGLYEALRSPEIIAFDKPEVPVGSVPTDDSVQGGLIERRKSPFNVSEKKKQPQKETDRQPKALKNPKRNIMHIKGGRFEFEHQYYALGEDAKSYEYKVDEKIKLVQIYTNTQFPAFHATHDQAFYAFTHIVDSLADLFLVYGREPRERFDEVRDVIMRKASEYVEELAKGKKEKHGR